MAETLPPGSARSGTAPRPANELAMVIGALASPRAYPRHVGSVQLLQTHISALFVTEERVYKLKKPVALEYVDYRALEDRRRGCEEEVRLNRRLAPEVYRGVLPVTRENDGRILVDGRGEVIDWVVEMVRLPADRMLDALLERGAVDAVQIERVAVTLAAFHATAESGPFINRHGLPRVIARTVHENLEQLQHLFTADSRLLAHVEITFVEQRLRRFLERNRDLMEQRLADVRIREGHGALHADNICLQGEDVIVYDCVEFDPALRCGDVASDLAFLAMDLDHREQARLAEVLVEAYVRMTSDSAVPALVGFYRVHRALVRAKVRLMTSQDASQSETARAAAFAEARRYAQLAVGYELPPTLVLTCGLSGTGKTRLARYVAGRLRAALVRSDLVRIAEFPATPEAERRGPEAQQQVYRAMLERVREALERGSPAVVDATCGSRELRRPFVEAAEQLGVPLHVLHLEVPERQTAEREHFEPPDELPRERVLVLDGTAAVEDSCDRLLERMVAEAALR